MYIYQQFMIWAYLLFLSIIPSIASYFTQFTAPLKTQSYGVSVLNYFFNYPGYTILKKYDKLPTKNIYELIKVLNKKEFEYFKKNYNVKLSDRELISLIEQDPYQMFCLLSINDRKNLYNRSVTPENKYELMPLLGVTTNDYEELYDMPHYCEISNTPYSRYEFADSTLDNVNIVSYNRFNKITETSGIIPKKYIKSHLELCEAIFRYGLPVSCGNKLTIKHNFTVVEDNVLTYLCFDGDNNLMSWHGDHDKVSTANNLMVRACVFEKKSKNSYNCYGGIRTYTNEKLMELIDKYDGDDLHIVSVKVPIDSTYFNDDTLYTYLFETIDLETLNKKSSDLSDMFENMDLAFERKMRKKLT